MHLVFERSKGRFKSGCNILALAWTPYYNERLFRQALFDYHQRQLINLNGVVGQSLNISQHQNQARSRSETRRESTSQGDNVSNSNNNNNNSSGNRSNEIDGAVRRPNQNAPSNSRLAELFQRYTYLKNRVPAKSAAAPSGDNQDISGASMRMASELDEGYGKMREFGWLVVGNVGKTIGITLTSLVPPPVDNHRKASGQSGNNEDLMQFDETNQEQSNVNSDKLCNSNLLSRFEYLRPDRRSSRQNYNLRGHLDEIILVRWNELYQKLATVDSKGNVLIWCKINDKFTIQTPFYNRTKSVADFKWSNDGKTALICYTDSFILVGSSSGQRSWHSMLNLNDYHITCASWSPNDEQLLLGVSNGNVVVIDLPNNELTELIVEQTNIRAICWSSSEVSLEDVQDNSTNRSTQSKQGNLEQQDDSRRSSFGRNTTVVSQRRLSRDCSVFSRYRFCSQGAASQQGQQPPVPPRGTDGTPPITVQESRIPNILAIDFANNSIKLYDGGLSDPKPTTIHVNQESYIMQWSSDGKILAVAGFNIHTTAPTVGCLKCRYLNAIKFYNHQGKLIYEYMMKYTRYPITAFTWAHADTRIFIATGQRLHCAKVFFGVPSLSLLATSTLQRCTKLPDKSDILESVVRSQFNSTVFDWQSFNCPIDIIRESSKSLVCKMDGELRERTLHERAAITNVCNNCLVYQYQLPSKLQSKIDQLFATTIRQPYYDNWTLNDVVWRVPSGEQRYYCTLICYASEREVSMNNYQYRTGSNDSGANDDHVHDQNKIFVLYVEFQGSLIPILRARRIGYLKPEFVIFDPDDGHSTQQKQRKVSDISQQSNSLCNDLVSPQRRFNLGHQSLSLAHHSGRPNSRPFELTDELAYCNHSGLDNCHDLHQYTDARASRHSSLDHQSPSDTEHYYNFDCDTVNRQNQKRLAELMSGRSPHQEPISLPASSNPYLLYMMGLSASHQSSSNGANLPVPARNQSRRSKTRRKLRVQSSSLSETNELVRIKSNIWGTKFKVINVSNRMIKHRSVIGAVTYKASILHLQPRQIHLNLKDMSNYCCLCSKHHHRALSAASRIGSRISKKEQRDNNQTLLDLPNISATNGVMDGLRSRPSRRSKRSDDNKVVLAVGDSLRIAPKMEQYRAASSIPRQFASVQSAASSPSMLQQHRLYKSDHNRSSNNRSHSQRQPPKAGPSYRGLDRPSTEDMNYSDAGPSTSFGQRDDILTLSLGQGDQVRVEMSSIKGMEDVSTESVHEYCQPKESNNEFLAMNKTLKSIQTITKMIVDLSSRAEADDKLDVNEGKDSPSPSKIVKRSEEDLNNIPSPLAGTSQGYIPPQAPVHRPRRQASKYQDNRLIGTQSASNTPLRTLRDRPSRNRDKRFNQSASVASDNPLPPPPLPVPIRRRISSSAKRFIDGSLRSLYSSTGYSTASDMEPEESEPLVCKPSRNWLQRDSLAGQRFGRQSQPCSPMRGSSPASTQTFKCQADAFLNSASSFGSQLISRLRNAGDIMNESVASGSTTPRKQHAPRIPIDHESDSFDDSDFTDSDDEEDRRPTSKSKDSNRKSNISNSVRDLRELVTTTKASNQDTRAKAQGKQRARRPNRRKSICPNANCCCAKEFKLNNRPPVWNESSQVYQLDFGGRVTQESAKNLQIDYDGNLALQFGRINRCTYTLDYRYPFNAVQAMAIALASLTQRLK